MTSRRKKFLIGTLITPMILSGCSTLGRSTLLRAGIGGATGTGVGFAAGRNTGSSLIGAGVGAALGAGISYFIHKNTEEKEALANALLRKKMPKEEYPTLRPPEASCTRTKEKIEGSHYIGPHIICDIEKPAVWTH